jgi:hypothetical protein
MRVLTQIFGFTDQVPRYSDRYNVVSAKKPTLDPSNLDPSLFPKAIWADHFEAATG